MILDLMKVKVRGKEWKQIYDQTKEQVEIKTERQVMDQVWDNILREVWDQSSE